MNYDGASSDELPVGLTFEQSTAGRLATLEALLEELQGQLRDEVRQRHDDRYDVLWHLSPLGIAKVESFFRPTGRLLTRQEVEEERRREASSTELITQVAELAARVEALAQKQEALEEDRDFQTWRADDD